MKRSICPKCKGIIKPEEESWVFWEGEIYHFYCIYGSAKEVLKDIE
jgi:hypothetical protein